MRGSTHELPVVAGIALIAPLYGICCWQAFGFFGPSLELQVNAFTSASAYSNIACFFAIAVAGLATPGRTEKAILHLAAPVLFAALLATRILVMGGVRNGAAYCFLGALAGSGVAALIVAWELELARRGPSSACRLAPLGTMLSPMVFLALFFIPPAWVANATMLVLVPASGILLRVSHGLDAADAAGGDMSPLSGAAAFDVYRAGIWQRAVPVLCGAALVLITSIASITILGSDVDSGTSVVLSNVGMLIASSAIYVLAGRRGQQVDLGRLFLFVAPVVIFMLFMSPFMGEVFALLLMCLGLIAFFAVQTVLMPHCCAVSARLGVSVASVYGFAAGLTYLSRCGGELVLTAISASHVSHEGQSLAVIAFAIYLLTTLAFILARGMGGLPWRLPISGTVGIAGGNEAEADAEPVPDMGEADAYDSSGKGPASPAGALDEDLLVARVMNRAGLSRREAQVALLLAGQLNSTQIAEALVVSENTVRSHIKSIYRKCGVHTRDEFRSYMRDLAAVPNAG